MKTLKWILFVTMWALLIGYPIVAFNFKFMNPFDNIHALWGWIGYIIYIYYIFPATLWSDFFDEIVNK